ncbi:MAG: UDP-N-acetylglucosamine 1-carboxyvinyltransferase [Candidatus Pacebacteria bacterium]|nr:UDP-N-acetylglucosamine 1-carboxyvinyltransferase [Candidatus Paceibacterota bacterium]
MAKFIVKGGKPLFGEVAIAGAKNAASKMFVASLLTDEQCIFKSVPAIGELEIVVELLRTIGSQVDIAGPTVSATAKEIVNNRVTQLSRKNRIPILALGPLLARTGEAEVPVLGGDKIGPRPVDIHLDGLAKLGARIEVTEKSFHAWAPEGGLRGAEIELRFPSVGATENIILAAVLAHGRTVIRNAALEPEIVDLIKLLQNMGAIIELHPPRTIIIEGVPKLHGTTHRVMPDRNEAVSFACLAIATNGRIKLRGAVQEHLITFLNTVRRLGGEYQVDEDGIAFWRARELSPVEIDTDVHPGYMTDWQQPLGVLLTQANGVSTIHETIYEDRFAYTNDLNSMGADITVSTQCPPGAPCRFAGRGLNHFAVIKGATPLASTNLVVRDLRSGIVDILAALVATGVSEIDGADEIDRGYEHIDARLRQLGAEITRA